MQAILSNSSHPSTPSTNAVLVWAFSVFSSLKVVAYLPTLFAIHASGRSDQYSLATWLIFVGSNVTMALWLHEQNGRIDKSVVASTINAVMSAAICLAIGWARWSGAS
jgi:hypothetical protein